MLRVEDHGSLAVAFSQTDERTVQRELQKLSRGLWLDKELDPAIGVYYVVKDRDGGDVTCVVWVDERTGRPKPLTLGIIEQLKRQQASADMHIVDKLVREQQKHRDKEKQRSADEYHDRVSEHLARIKAAEGRTLSPYWRPKRFGAK